MNEKNPSRVILLVEDDPDDIYLISEAITECNLDCVIKIAQNGEELLDYLYQRGEFDDPHDSPRPDLILLDLNMPRKDGREALEEIKADLGLRTIPIVILTTSKSDQDLLITYELGASGFVTKPVSFNDLRESICKIGNYWFDTVRLPDEDSKK